MQRVITMRKKKKKRQVIDKKIKARKRDLKGNKAQKRIPVSFYKNNCKKKMKKICMRNKSFA